MKENIKLIGVLNQILIDELNEVNHNVFHSKINANINDKILFEEIAKETTEELKQAEWLVKRIMVLEVLRTRQLSISISQNNSAKSYEKSRSVGHS